MIYFNGNTYRYLSDKFYIGNRQIGEVYIGNTKVYPESSNIIDGVQLKGVNLNLNVYDTGIAPTKNTTVEICFENKQSIGNFGFPIFGTHHDVYYAQGGKDESYNPKGDNIQSSFYKSTGYNDNITGDWGNGCSGRNNDTCKKWKNKTSFHVILKQNNAYLRYGGESVQGDGNLSISQNSFYNTNYDTSKSDNIISVDNNYWNNKISKTDSETGNSIDGKFFTIRLGKINDYSSSNGQYAIGQGIGKSFYGNSNLYVSNKSGSTKDSYAGNNTENIPITGGNLWIGTHNRNFSNSADAVNPNKIRGHLSINGFEQLKNYSQQQIKDYISGESNDLHKELFKSGELEWVYIAIERRNSNGDLMTDNTNGKKFKYIFIPEETEIIDPNNTKMKLVVFKKYGVKSNDDKKWDFENPLEIVVPFMKCTAYTI